MLQGMHIYDIGLAFQGGKSARVAIQSNHIYGINIDPSGATDKTFEYQQVTPATTWGDGTPPVITHNLAKFPSITVIDTARYSGYWAV